MNSGEWQLAAILNFVMLGLCHEHSIVKAYASIKEYCHRVSGGAYAAHKIREAKSNGHIKKN